MIYCALPFRAWKSMPIHRRKILRTVGRAANITPKWGMCRAISIKKALTSLWIPRTVTVAWPWLPIFLVKRKKQRFTASGQKIIKTSSIRKPALCAESGRTEVLNPILIRSCGAEIIPRQPPGRPRLLCSTTLTVWRGFTEEKIN